MEERRRITTVRQLELMVEFLEQHRDLALGRVRSKEARNIASRLWRECAEVLNAEGPARTGKEWAKVWNDQKCRIRAKLVLITVNQRATGGGPSNAPSLTSLEERVAQILGRDIGPLPDVRQDQFSTNDEDMVVVEEVVEEENDATSIVFNIAETECQPAQQEPFETVTSPVSPVPSITGQFPATPANVVRRERRRAERASRQPIARAPAQTSRTALEESRTMVLEIQKIKAEACLQNAQSFKIVAEALKLVAESIDRWSKKDCQQAGQEQT